MYVVDSFGNIITEKQYWNQSIIYGKLPEFKTYFEALVYAKKIVLKRLAQIEKELENIDLEDDSHSH